MKELFPFFFKGIRGVHFVIILFFSEMCFEAHLGRKISFIEFLIE